ncbi:TIGR02391 family protein [Mycolicibacterium sp. Dal123E01]|uniref:TIGR02391 family protein n=1 Tax=Mycolicibacterium sp. Dal123E01 TaxID=3457578 RepID=UPI00403EA68E
MCSTRTRPLSISPRRRPTPTRRRTSGRASSFLFMGAAQGLRNPRGHGGDLDTDGVEAAEMLSLASLLMRALDRAENQLALQPPDLDTAGEWDEDAPGSLDLIAVAEAAMPELKATIEEMAACLTKFGEVTEAYSPKITAAAQNPSMAARLAVIQAFANELKPPAQRFRELSAEYVGQMVDLNGGIDAMTHLQPFDEMTPEEQSDFRDLAESVKYLRDSSVEGIGAADFMSRGFQDVAKLSTALKKPSADLREGVRQMQSVQHYNDEWVQAFIDLGVLEATSTS